MIWDANLPPAQEPPPPDPVEVFLARLSAEGWTWALGQMVTKCPVHGLQVQEASPCWLLSWKGHTWAVPQSKAGHLNLAGSWAN